MQIEQIARIQSPRVIRIGGGVAQEIGEVLEQLGLSRPLIVTDQKLVQLGHVQTVTDVLEASKIVWSVFDEVIEDPTDNCVEAGLTVLRNGNFVQNPIYSTSLLCEVPGGYQVDGLPPDAINS